MIAIDIGDARTEADVRCAVMNAVFDDRDRSLESAVEMALKAGIEFERARIHSILEKIIPRPGLEKVLIIQALDRTATVESVARFMAEFPIGEAHHTSLRGKLHVVVNSNERGPQ